MKKPPKPPPCGADFRAQMVEQILRLLRFCQPDDAIAILEEARQACRTFDEIYADSEVAVYRATAAARDTAGKARLAKAPPKTPHDDGDFG